MRTLLLLLATVTLVTVCSAKGKHCKYKKGGKWSDCADGKQTSTKILDEGSDASCESTKVKTRPCVPGGKEKCKYEKGNWSECDENNTQTRIMTLVKGNCPITKTKTRKCKKGCKYQKGVWSECNPTTKKMTRKLTLTEGGSHCLPTKMREKRCKKSKAGRKGRSKGKRGRTRRPDSSPSLSSSSSSLSSSSLSSSTKRIQKRPKPYYQEQSDESLPQVHGRRPSESKNTKRSRPQRRKKHIYASTLPSASVKPIQGLTFQSQTVALPRKQTDSKNLDLKSTVNGVTASFIVMKSSKKRTRTRESLTKAPLPSMKTAGSTEDKAATTDTSKSMSGTTARSCSWYKLTCWMSNTNTTELPGDKSFTTVTSMSTQAMSDTTARSCPWYKPTCWMSNTNTTELPEDPISTTDASLSPQTDTPNRVCSWYDWSC